MPEASQTDVLIHIFEHQPISATEIEKEFVRPQKDKAKPRIARGTMYNWLGKLHSSGEITRKYDETRKKGGSYAYYSISPEHSEEIEKEYLKRKIIRKVEEYSKDDIANLLEYITDLESENRYKELQANDNLPYNLFDKAESLLNEKTEYQDDEIHLKKASLNDHNYEKWTRIKYVKDSEGSVKYVVYAISKELIKHEKEAERRYLKKLKTDYKITDQRWSEIEPTITDMIKSGRVDLEIEQYVREHIHPKN